MHLLLHCGCKDSSESPRHLHARLEDAPSSSASVLGSQQRLSQPAAKQLGYERFNINSSYSAESPASSHAIHRHAATVSANNLSIPSSSGSNLVVAPTPSVKASLDPFKSGRVAPLWLEGEEKSMGLPDGEVPNFQTFCPYERWSVAFASPGDFTIKAAHVKRSSGTVLFNLALVGLPVPPPSASSVTSPHHSLSRGRAEANHVSTSFFSMYASSDQRYAQFPRPRQDKVQSVSIVTKTEEEITGFVHSMALRLPGHKIVSSFTRKMNKAGRKLDDRIAAVVDVLSFILSITHIGAHGLIPVKEPVPQDLRVRLFLHLHCWNTHMGAAPTGSNSCDGRLESQSHSEKMPTPTRKSIPSEWFTTSALPSKVALLSNVSSSGAKASTSMRQSMSSSNLPRMRRRSLPQPAVPMPYCTTYVPPNAWRKKAKSVAGAFTVVVSGIHVLDDGVVEYMLTVLFVDNLSPSSAPRMKTVGHRYQEFNDLAVHIRHKTKMNVSMPPKTLFRSVDPAFLETRSVDLQCFIDTLLPLHFIGMLDQRIDMAAEPRVRAFLELPTVQWSVVAELPTKKDLDRFRALSNSSTASSRSLSLPKESDDEDSDDGVHDDDEDDGSGGDERVFADFENRVDRPFLSNRRSISSQYYPVSRGVA
ncbi:hypothetical protein DYB32_004209 [Aphanomyces invadans]|uniref:PX domain-containing protein n=1 Tax=Aphanomyces invadans TaxID=157072 RepID=A0A418AY67_9STRA|nr:hypothetical protein DYB32_004209 [Aphanomyces invadans]